MIEGRWPLFSMLVLRDHPEVALPDTEVPHMNLRYQLRAYESPLPFSIIHSVGSNPSALGVETSFLFWQISYICFKLHRKMIISLNASVRFIESPKCILWLILDINSSRFCLQKSSHCYYSLVKGYTSCSLSMQPACKVSSDISQITMSQEPY